MKDNQESSINVWLWIFAILDLVCIITAIMNFDTEQWLSCCIVLLVAIVWDIVFFYVMIKDLIYLFSKGKQK